MLLFIDFPKAFDTIDSTILLLKLEFDYNFVESTLKLFANYFEDRKQIVKYGYTFSDTENIVLYLKEES